MVIKATGDSAGTLSTVGETVQVTAPEKRTEESGSSTSTAFPAHPEASAPFEEVDENGGEFPLGPEPSTPFEEVNGKVGELRKEALEIQEEIASITAWNAFCGDRVRTVYRNDPRDRWCSWSFITIYCFHSSPPRKVSDGQGVAIICGFVVAVALSALCINLVNHFQHQNMAIDIEIFEEKVSELDDTGQKAKFKEITQVLKEQNRIQNNWNLIGLALSVAIVAAGIVALVGYGIAFMPVLYAGAFTAVALASIGVAILVGYKCVSEVNNEALKAINLAKKSAF